MNSLLFLFHWLYISGLFMTWLCSCYITSVRLESAFWILSVGNGLPWVCTYKCSLSPLRILTSASKAISFCICGLSHHLCGTLSRIKTVMWDYKSSLIVLHRVNCEMLIWWIAVNIFVRVVSLSSQSSLMSFSAPFSIAPIWWFSLCCFATASVFIAILWLTYNKVEGRNNTLLWNIFTYTGKSGNTVNQVPR